jgi:hypothetical protein
MRREPHSGRWGIPVGEFGFIPNKVWRVVETMSRKKRRTLRQRLFSDIRAQFLTCFPRNTRTHTQFASRLSRVSRARGKHVRN